MRRRYCSQGARGRGVGRVSAGDVTYLLQGQETLDKVPPWSSRLREEGEGPDSRCGERACSKSNCKRGWGMQRASLPVDAGFSGTQGSASLPRVHHLESPTRSPLHLQASITSTPAHIHPASAWCQVLNSRTCLKAGISGGLSVLPARRSRNLAPFP